MENAIGMNQSKRRGFNGTKIIKREDRDKKDAFSKRGIAPSMSAIGMLGKATVYLRVFERIRRCKSSSSLSGVKRDEDGVKPVSKSPSSRTFASSPTLLPVMATTERYP